MALAPVVSMDLAVPTGSSRGAARLTMLSPMRVMKSPPKVRGCSGADGPLLALDRNEDSSSSLSTLNEGSARLSTCFLVDRSSCWNSGSTTSALISPMTVMITVKTRAFPAGPSPYLHPLQVPAQQLRHSSSGRLG